MSQKEELDKLKETFNQLFLDGFKYGNSCITSNRKGEIKRVHPMSIIINTNKGVYEELQDMDITYHELTKKDFDKFVVEYNKANTSVNYLKLAVDIKFLSLLSDDLFLLTINVYELVCGQETQDYILERYNKLKQQEDASNTIT